MTPRFGKTMILGSVAALWLAGPIPGARGWQDRARDMPRPPSIRHDLAPEIMYEDIEIFRRILDRAIFSLPGVWQGQADKAQANLKDHFPAYQNQAQFYFNLDYQSFLNMDQHFAVDLKGAQGFYLPGYGIVVSATVPVHSLEIVSLASAEEPKLMTLWDRTRIELHGEKPLQEKNPPAKNVSLADAIIRIMAENGRHLSQLPDNEMLTVAVTLRHDQRCDSCHTMAASAGWKAGMGVQSANSGIKNKFGQKDTKPLAASPPDFNEMYSRYTSGSGKVGNESKEGGSFSNTEADNYSRLGDMRLKQSRADEALEAYSSAVKIYAKLAEAAKDAADYQDYLKNLYMKVGQAQLARGDEVAALQALKLAAKGTMKQPAIPSAPQAPADGFLPDKLILSAPKQLLLQVGAGKIAMQDFRNQVTLNYYPFSGVDKTLKKDGKVSPPAQVKP